MRFTLKNMRMPKDLQKQRLISMKRRKDLKILQSLGFITVLLVEVIINLLKKIKENDRKKKGDLKDQQKTS